MNQEFTCVESFCGAGGMGIGLARAGFNVKLAFDLNQLAVETYSGVIGTRCQVADASKITASEIESLSGIESGTLDLFSGGPPCQGFSKQRRGAH